MEAKVIWSMFYVGYNNMDAMENAYGGQMGLICFKNMQNSVGYDDDCYRRSFHLAAQSLRNIKGYKSYPYDPNVTILNSIKKILEHCGVTW